MKPTTNRESVGAVYFTDEDKGFEYGAGAFWFQENPLTIEGVLPGGTHFSLPLDGSRGWQWDGNKEKPTITPSIATSITWGEERERIELWHGFLTAGRFVSC